MYTNLFSPTATGNEWTNIWFKTRYGTFHVVSYDMYVTVSDHGVHLTGRNILHLCNISHKTPLSITVHHEWCAQSQKGRISYNDVMGYQIMFYILVVNSCMKGAHKLLNRFRHMFMWHCFKATCVCVTKYKTFFS